MPGFHGLVAATLLILSAFAASAQEAPASVSSSFQPGPGQGAYLVLTDIHFDSFADPTLVPRLIAAPAEEWETIFRSGAQAFAQFRSDTNYPLLRSVLDAAAATGSTYDFVLIPGDFIAHQFRRKFIAATGGLDGYESFVEKTMAFVYGLVQQRFPGLQVIGTFGNEDSDCGDYALSPKSRLFETLADAWPILKSDPVAAADFRAGGSYDIAHPTVPKLRIAVMNDVYLSAGYRDCDPADGDPGPAMLSWLEWRLFRAAEAGERVTLLSHIPPGIDAYSSAYGRRSCAANTKPFWQRPNLDRFLELVDRYRSVLTPVVTGHTHMDEFRVISSADGQPLLGIKIFPAVSPIFGNAPSFAVVAYDKTDGALRDYAIWGLRNLASGGAPEWRQEYVFSETYGRPVFDAATAQSLALAIRDDPATRETFTRFYAGIGSGEHPVTPENWRAFSCAQTEFQSPDFTSCSCGG
jgi:hypothetical protein